MKNTTDSFRTTVAQVPPRYGEKPCVEQLPLHDLVRMEFGRAVHEPRWRCLTLYTVTHTVRVASKSVHGVLWRFS